MGKIRHILPLIICMAAIVTSCKKVIDLKLSDADAQLVIEGNVTDLPGSQYVLISRSVPFGNTNTYPTVSGAVVKVTDNTNNSTFTLRETSPGSYSSSSFFGRSRRNYTLRVTLDGKTYSATSEMPDKVFLDSVGVSLQTFGKTTSKTVAVYYQDPAGVKNQYRMLLYVNNVQIKNIFVRNDQFGDGRVVQALLYQDQVTIEVGDRIDVEFQCLDEPIYKYWYTFNQQDNSNFNNSATPVNPISNFDGNILGYFSVHTVQLRSFVVR